MPSTILNMRSALRRAKECKQPKEPPPRWRGYFIMKNGSERYTPAVDAEWKAWETIADTFNPDRGPAWASDVRTYGVEQCPPKS